MLSGRTPTAAEQAYLDAVSDLGCIICLLYRNQESPAEIHHTDGKTKPGCHFLILPLCKPHHRDEGPSKGFVSRADGKKAFEEAYMPEQDLIIVVRKAVELNRHKTISSLGGRRCDHLTTEGVSSE
jgi:hypothetical protein